MTGPMALKLAIDNYRLYFYEGPHRDRTMALEKEMETYNKKLAECAAHEGKYVLIKGDVIVDFFASYEDAIKEGYQRYSLEPFLVKQIQSVAQVQFISRMFDPMLTGCKV